MAALNKAKAKPVAKITPLKLGISANGNVQIVKDAKQRLFEIAVASYWGGDKGTTTHSEAFKVVQSLVLSGDHDYIANTILFARGSMGIRTFSIALTVQFAKFLHEQKKSYQHMRALVRDVISRADEINEMYAYALTVFGSKGSIPLAIKKGVADAFNKFDAYQFGKYNRAGAISFKDTLRIVHPKPIDGLHGEIFQKIIEEKLEAPYTWEVELSKNGQLPSSEQKSKAQLWTELFNSGKMGYMGVLRNLRNISEAGVSDAVCNGVVKYITNEQNILRSKQFPYSFVTASQQVQNYKFKEAALTAADLSLCNIPKIGERVVVIVDVSGSMGTGPGSAREIACFFAAAIAKSHQTADKLEVIAFSNAAKKIAISSQLLSGNVVQIANHISTSGGGGGTAFDRAIEHVNRLSWKPDTIFVLSDGDVNPMKARGHFGDSWVPAGWNKDATRICFNFREAKTTPMGVENGWHYLGGYSDKIFNYLGYIREGNQMADALDKPYGQYVKIS